MKTLHTQTTAFTKRLFKLERCGKYEEALAELGEIWEDTTTFPSVEEFELRSAAEIILRCGSLIGFLGHNKQIPNAQEKSKNLLTEARRRFLDIYDIEKIAECENYLSLAYWRMGELVEAETWIEESLAHNLSNSIDTRLYSYIIESKIDFANNKYEKVCKNFTELENDFLKYADSFLLGNFYNNWGLALKNLQKTIKALPALELGKYHYFKSGNKVHSALAENNLAQLYKAERKFIKAHEAIDNAAKIFKQIKDQTREGFSLDTKAQIYFAEGKYAEALKTIEAAIKILKKGENAAYLTETYLTKAKTLIFLDDFTAATFSLFDGVQIARTQISEEAAKKLVEEFEKTLHEKNTPKPAEKITELQTISENLELVIPPEIAHYSEFQGIWINNTHLESIGLKKGSLAIIAKETIRRGDLAAIIEIETDEVSCGFYDMDFGIISMEGINSEPQLFDEGNVKILGKIVGVCNSGKSPDGKMIIEPINI